MYMLYIIYVLPLETHLSKKDGCDSINCLISPHICACPKTGYGLSTSCVVVPVMFMGFEVIVRFVDIGGPSLFKLSIHIVARGYFNN